MLRIFFKTFGRYLWLIIQIGGFKFGFPIRFMIAYMVWSTCLFLSTGAMIVASLFEPLFFPTIVTVTLYVYSMAVVLFPWFQFLVLAVLPIWPIIFLLEIAVDILYSVKYYFQRRPQINVLRSWKVAAQLKSANNGYGATQFYSVVDVDTSVVDDPFWPNASSIFMVEIRRRCLIWKTMTIWQVSMLDGGRKKVHVFHDAFGWTDANLFGRQLDTTATMDRISCFNSNGVIFIIWEDRQLNQITFYVYDHRYKKSGVYEAPAAYSQLGGWTLCVRCLGRLVNKVGSMNGWRIRIYDTRWVLPRAGIENTVLELRDGKVRMISFDESIYFGNFPTVSDYTAIKCADGLFGFYLGHAPWVGEILMFDPVDGQFDRHIHWAPGVRFGEPCYDRYVVLGSPSLGNEAHRWQYSPTVINAQECILACTDGTVFRTQLAMPSSLKYLAAKALFRADPNLRQRMSANGFRQFSGMSGMEGNFN